MCYKLTLRYRRRYSRPVCEQSSAKFCVFMSLTNANTLAKPKQTY